MSDHTPGPWMVSHFVSDDGCADVTDAGIYEIEEANERILELLREKSFEGAAREADANRRLIAAAPDLLAALKVARLYVANLEEGAREDPDPDLALADKIHKDVVMVDAAIAKAEKS